MEPDFTGPEARAAAEAFLKEVGPKADLHLSLNVGRYRGDGAWYLSLYPEGMVGKGPAFGIYGDRIRDLLAEAVSKWEEIRESHVNRTISAMALEIIRLTDANGEATDAALRSANFDGEIVARYGAKAAERATDMAGRGPFALKVLGGGNGAPKWENIEEDDA